jgi:hypothetical protein
MTTIRRNTFPIRQKHIFSSVGVFEYFEETILRIPSLSGHKTLFHPWDFLIFQRDYPENNFAIRQKKIRGAL